MDLKLCSGQVALTSAYLEGARESNGPPISCLVTTSWTVIMPVRIDVDLIMLTGIFDLCYAH